MDTNADSSLGLQATPPTEMGLWQSQPALLHAGFGVDPDVTVAALVTGPGGHHCVLDAHGGGEVALALAARGAARVLTVPLLDATGAAAVLSLKMAALRSLTRGEYLRFLGLLRSGAPTRSALYSRVRLHLAPVDRIFWDRHEDALLKGLFLLEADVAQGRLVRNLLRAHLPKEAYRTLLYGDLRARLATFDQHIAGRRFWENALRMCAVRGQFRICLDGESSPLTCSDPMSALRRLVSTGPASSPVWVRAFGNDAGVEASLPWHLTPTGFDALRQNLDALSVALDPLAALKTDSRKFDAFDLTRARSMLSAETFARVLGCVVAAARPGTRILVAASDVAGVSLPPELVRDAALEAHVAASDRAPIACAREVYRRHALA